MLKTGQRFTPVCLIYFTILKFGKPYPGEYPLLADNTSHRLKKIVVFTGSGISAESGIRTFRDSGGLWEEFDISEVATPEAWERNPGLVQKFYNDRRKQVLEAKPNAAHLALAQLESRFETMIITQNIDDLHERAGSKSIIHLHGEIRKARSSRYHELIYDISGTEIVPGSTCEQGYPLRPHIVWFGEAVPQMIPAMQQVMTADCFIIIGTSLEVYPAASLVEYAPVHIPKYFIDPAAVNPYGVNHLTIIREKASVAVPQLVSKLMENQ
jgi:NAD-dependent deacetylase